MTSTLPTLDCQSLTETFDQWRIDQQELENDLGESLAALDAYQAHLDQWQQQLANERQQLAREHDELASQRNEFLAEKSRLDSDRTATSDQSEQIAVIRDQLADAREKIAALSTDLLAKSEELRALDNKRAELTTQVELLRVREQTLLDSLERERQHLADQQAEWSDELKHMSELLERQVVASKDEHVRDSSTDPVVGSIVAQFDKLRQQQAMGRRSPQKK